MLKSESSEKAPKKRRVERESTGTGPILNTSTSTPVKKNSRPSTTTDDDNEFKLYISKFPQSPSGAVKTWQQCKQRIEDVEDSLEKLLVDDDSLSAEEKYRRARMLARSLIGPE